LAATRKRPSEIHLNAPDRLWPTTTALAHHPGLPPVWRIAAHGPNPQARFRSVGQVLPAQPLSVFHADRLDRPI